MTPFSNIERYIWVGCVMCRCDFTFPTMSPLATPAGIEWISANYELIKSGDLSQAVRDGILTNDQAGVIKAAVQELNG
jgi:hypothetical protein